jgi:hypothetical protein
MAADIGISSWMISIHRFPHEKSRRIEMHLESLGFFLSVHLLVWSGRTMRR